MAADGRIIIDTKINSEGVETGTKEINAAFKRTADSLQYDMKSMQKFVDDYAAGLSKTTESSNDFLRTLQNLENQLKSLESNGFYFGDEEYDNAYLKLEKVKQALADYKHELVSPAPDANIFDASSMEGKIEHLTSELVLLRRQGKGFGDEAFDSAYKSLIKAQDELKAYKKELTKKEEPLQLPVSIDTSTMEGQINLLKAKLEGLRNQGKGFGDKEFDSTAQALKRAEQELTNYKNNLFKTEEQVRKEAEQQERLNQKLEETAKKEQEVAAHAAMLKEIGDNAQVSSPRIVQLRKELEELNARQKILEDAGVGLGNQEYDQNIQNINRIKLEMDDYRKSLLKTDDAQDQFNKSLENTEKSSKKSGNSLMRMMGTGLLMGMVFQGFYAITSAAAEGMSNLSQYSGETNATLSTLLSSLTQLKNAFATAFSPILTAIAPALNYLINLLTAAATAVAQLAAVLTGKGTFVKATKVQQDYAASLKETGSAASSAGKDAKKALAPFDDLVQIQQQGTESSGGTGGGGQEIPPSEMFEEVSVSNNLVQALESIKQKALKVYGIFKKGFTVGFVDTSALTTIQSSLQSIKQSVSSIFNDPEVQNAGQVWANKIIYSLGLVAGSVGSIGATIAANITGGIALYLQESTGLIKQYLINMFDISGDIALIGAQFAAAVATIFSVFSEENGQVFTANIIGIFLNSFMQLTELAAKAGRDILDAVTGPIIENLELFRTALDGLLGIAGDILGTLNELVTDTFAKMNQVYDEHIKPLFDSFKIGFTEIYQAALNAFNTYILPAFEKAAKKFDEFKDQYLQPLIDKFLDFAGRVIDVVRVVWEEQLQPFITWAIETFAPIIGQAIDLIVDKFFAFQETASVVIGIVIDVLNILMEFIKGSFTGDWESAWSNIKDIFKDIWNGIVSLAEKAINFIIDSLNKISFDVPEWVAGIGGEHFGFEIEPVHLPRLATGTVIPPRAGEFAAILGDNRRETEVVSPLSTIKQALLEAIAEAGGLGTGGTTITLRFEGSMGALARMLKPELDREAARKGVNLVIVGGR